MSKYPERIINSAYTTEELEWLKMRSDENMINFYKDELKHIHETGKCLLSQRAREKLRRGGFIKILNRNNKMGVTRYGLAPFCLLILEKIE
jgi:hypothetical protein